MTQTMRDAFERINREVATLACGLDAVAQLIPKDDDSNLAHLFRAFHNHACITLDTIEFWKLQLGLEEEPDPFDSVPVGPAVTKAAMGGDHAEI